MAQNREELYRRMGLTEAPAKPMPGPEARDAFPEETDQELQQRFPEEYERRVAYQQQVSAALEPIHDALRREHPDLANTPHEAAITARVGKTLVYDFQTRVPGARKYFDSNGVLRLDQYQALCEAAIALYRHEADLPSDGDKVDQEIAAREAVITRKRGYGFQRNEVSDSMNGR